MRVWIYAFRGQIRRETIEDRIEVHCLRASLSEQDLENVGGASGRANGVCVRRLFEKGLIS